ncbi:MAG: aspartate kinase, partial [Desulfobacula sp.]|nr:aspartate kinase [Desulfobacula sp.]
MALRVQKYGGTSVADIERINNVADRVQKTHDQGDKVVVVLSAMSGVTDSLISLAKEASKTPDKRELDVLLATGEQTTAALLAMILKSRGYKAKSFLGFQAGIRTDKSSGKARILDINGHNIKSALKEGNIAVVAGFQGVDEEGTITTLGRGGSDTSAVAIASSLKADVCEIFTDVDGVYTTDPRICSSARKINKISYEEMLEMAILGAKVLQIRSVEFAKKYNVPIHVRSSFNEEEGTMVVNESSDMESVIVSGITCDMNEARITLKRVPDQPGVSAKIFTPLAQAEISVDMIIQNTRSGGETDLTFTVTKDDFERAKEIS